MQTLQVDHVQTLTSAPFVLELYVGDDVRSKVIWHQLEEVLPQRLEAMAKVFYGIAREEGILAGMGLNPEPGDGQTWEVDISFVSDPVIARVNQEHRDKPQATDVLSFPQFPSHQEDADSSEEMDEWSALKNLPEVPLGSIMLSVDWAVEHATDPSEDVPHLPADTNPLERYLLERVCHGLLHLMGINHDTMADYNRVIGIQKRVLHAVFED